jgi:cytochrome c-type biogenesis protein CcmH
LLSSGKTEEDVYGIFEEKFGPSVHAVPKAEGFNLLAWILPLVGLLAGAVVVVAVFRRLKPEVSSEKVGPAPEIDEKYRKLLDRELRG